MNKEEYKKYDEQPGSLYFYPRTLQAIKTDPSKASVLIELMRKDNPMLITDLTRTINYL